MPRHLLRDDDLTHDEQLQLIALATEMKIDRQRHQPFRGNQAVALMFDKPSTRTRLSFTVGVTELGGFPLLLDSHTTQMGRGESVEDTTRVLDRQVSTIVWRTFAQADLQTMAAISRVPVINSLSDEFHPCQLLADLLTITEQKGNLSGLKVAYLGDTSNNMAHSYLLACATAGMHITMAGPASSLPNPAVVHRATELAAKHSGSVEVTNDAKHATYEADVVTTDTWASMGQSPVTSDKNRTFQPFQINEELMGAAKPDAIVLHCLPAYRGKEITASVLDGPQSVVWDQAENRLHAQKALMTLLKQWS